MGAIDPYIARAKTAGHFKIAGENSLTAGEVFFTALGVLIILFGAKAKIPAKFRLPLGIAVIFAGEWVF